MKYCSNCGAAVAFRIPPRGQPSRHVCRAMRHHPLPEPQAGGGRAGRVGEPHPAVPGAIEPRSGMWTLPAGLVENAGDHRPGRRARDAGGGLRAHRGGRAVYPDRRAAHQPGARHLPRPPARPRLPPARSGSRSRCLREDDPLGPHRLPLDRDQPAPLLRGPPQRPLPLHTAASPAAEWR